MVTCWTSCAEGENPSTSLHWEKTLTIETSCCSQNQSKCDQCNWWSVIVWSACGFTKTSLYLITVRAGMDTWPWSPLQWDFCPLKTEDHLIKVGSKSFMSSCLFLCHPKSFCFVLSYVCSSSLVCPHFASSYLFSSHLFSSLLMPSLFLSSHLVSSVSSHFVFLVFLVLSLLMPSLYLLVLSLHFFSISSYLFLSHIVLSFSSFLLSSSHVFLSLFYPFSYPGSSLLISSNIFLFCLLF